MHTALVHGVEVAGVGCDCQKKVKFGAGKTLPPSRCCANLFKLLLSYLSIHISVLAARSKGPKQGLDRAGAAMWRNWISPALTATSSPLLLRLASTCTGWSAVSQEDILCFFQRRRVCGLRGVKPTGFDFPCQEKGCGRAFSNPMGLAQHRYAMHTWVMGVVKSDQQFSLVLNPSNILVLDDPN